MNRGLNLTEFLIIFIVLVILGLIVFFIINPFKILAEKRDNQRISDLSSLQMAIDIWQTNQKRANSQFGKDGEIYASNDMEANDKIDGTGQPVTNAIVQDPLPSNTTFVSADNNGQNINNTITWNLGNLAAFATGQVSFQVRAP